MLAEYGAVFRFATPKTFSIKARGLGCESEGQKYFQVSVTDAGMEIDFFFVMRDILGLHARRDKGLD